MTKPATQIFFSIIGAERRNINKHNNHERFPKQWLWEHANEQKTQQNHHLQKYFKQDVKWLRKKPL